MPIPDKMLSAFSTSIWAKVCLLREAQLSERHTKRVKESISDDIKKCTDCTDTRASVAAYEKAHDMKIDLAQMGWHDQPRFDPKRKIFHRDHTITVETIRQQCLDAQSIELIRVALESSIVSWILKSEDRRLTANGHRSLRPDWKHAYQQAGITLKEENPEQIGAVNPHACGTSGISPAEQARMPEASGDT